MEKFTAYTNNLRKKLKVHMEADSLNTYQIETRTGVHRQIVARFVKEDFNGITYENGMALRTYLQRLIKDGKLAK
jgi:hypothetical protein